MKPLRGSRPRGRRSPAPSKLAVLVKSGRATKAAVTAANEAIAAAKADFDAKKADATKHLKEIFAPWTKKLDARSPRSTRRLPTRAWTWQADR